MSSYITEPSKLGVIMVITQQAGTSNYKLRFKEDTPLIYVAQDLMKEIKLNRIRFDTNLTVGLINSQGHKKTGQFTVATVIARMLNEVYGYNELNKAG